ncbi:MAG: [FeFe] hydrogenase H-cluster maturation GTPase HydF [Bacteroidales bacterium]|nr:[FeFe] hydrogenase H-cluster maturation GTPase HydF [Bacteroidales bacterium]
MKKGKDLKPHVGIFGRRNLGKSSLINCLTGQDIAIVSDYAGTTTDPVKKSIEIFGVGPVIVTDTAGIDDSGDLGKMRIDKTLSVIPNLDLALLLISENTFDNYESELVKSFNEYDLPFIIVHSKSDIFPLEHEFIRQIESQFNKSILSFNIFEKKAKEELISTIQNAVPETSYVKPSLFKDLIGAKDIVLLITPIDSEAPEGRMILPQVMALRDVLDNDAICVTVKETELEDFLKLNLPVKLALTDSQVFGMVSKIVPPSIPLTSFSITFARFKGHFEAFIEGTNHISKLKEGDKILMLESCTHQLSCDDIGRFKLPKWIKEYTGKQLEFEFAGGLSTFPSEIESYAMVIQCGGCVVTQKQLYNRLLPFVKRNIPVSNYGMAIAYVNGVFDRVVAPFTNLIT